MKRIILMILALIMLIAAGCSGGSANELPKSSATAQPTAQTAKTPEPTPEPNTLAVNENADKASNFTLEITLDAEKHSLSVNQKIDYLNPSEDALSQIYFNVIPDAFKKDGGGTSVKSIKIAGEQTSMKNVKGTVYSADIPKPVKKGKRTEIELVYEVNIPNIVNRFGYQETYFNLGNFIITPAVYEKDGYVSQPYVDLGDAFYTDIANYDVKINVPEGYKTAATGEKGEDGAYHAKNVRDFAFCASDKYETLETDANGVKVTAYFGSELELTAKRVIDVAKKSLILLSEKFGQYPYKTLDVVMNGLTSGVNGMEYPALIMIAPEVPLEVFADEGMDYETDQNAVPSVLSLDDSVCHEVAHQWFYGIVGNNQVTEAWLDEGFARFCEFIYESAYPPHLTEENEYFLKKSRLKNIAESVMGDGDDDTQDSKDDRPKLTKSLYYWNENDPMSYSDIYEYGSTLIYSIYNKMGEEEFFKAAREYVNTFKYGFVTTEDFKGFWSKKADVKGIFDAFITED